MSQIGKGLYVYGLMQENKNKKLVEMTGIDNIHNLFIIVLGDISIVVSYVDLDEYGDGKIKEKLEDISWAAEKAKAHYYIVNQLSKNCIFLPVKFCTIYLNEEDLKIVFSNCREKINEAFEYFEDKVEWTLKVYCDKRKFIEICIEEEKAELDTALKDKAKKKITKLKEELWELLSAKTVKVKLNNNSLNHLHERKLDIILNTAVLINKGKLDELCDFIKELKERHKLSYIYFELVGPWPFYNFASLFISM